MKDIIFDRETKDFQMWLDSEFVGYANSRDEAEAELDRLVFERLSK